MLKVKKGDTVLLGLSDINMQRLKEGQPIKFNMSELDLPPMEVVIFNGRTEDSMFLSLDANIDLDKTKIKYS